MIKSGRLRLENDRGCFACGDKNPQGLRMAFALTADGGLRSEFTAEARLQGFRGFLHGGIMALLLDEMMVNLLWMRGHPAVSAEFRVRLKQPVRTGERIVLESRITETTRRLFKTEAQAFSASGGLVAEAGGVCLKIPDARLAGAPSAGQAETKSRR